MSCSSSNNCNSRASSWKKWPLPANAGSTVSHKKATYITSLSSSFLDLNRCGLPVSDAHASRELEPLVFKVNANVATMVKRLPNCEQVRFRCDESLITT